MRGLPRGITLFAAVAVCTGAFGATYSTVRKPPITAPLLELSVSPTLPACSDATQRCWATSPDIATLAVAPGEAFVLAFGCEAPPVQGVVRVKFLYLPMATLVDDACRTVGMIVNVGDPTPSLDVDYDGHRYTRALSFDQWTPLQLIDADPVVYLKLERATTQVP